MGGLFGVFFILGGLQAQTSSNLKHLLGGFVSSSDFSQILGQIKEVCGSKNMVFALEGLQKSHFHLSWIFDHFGLHFGGHSGAVWDPKLAFDSPRAARGAEKGGLETRSEKGAKKYRKTCEKGAWRDHGEEGGDPLINR